MNELKLELREQCLVWSENPKGTCSYMAYTWAGKQVYGKPFGP